MGLGLELGLGVGIGAGVGTGVRAGVGVAVNADQRGAEGTAQVCKGCGRLGSDPIDCGDGLGFARMGLRGFGSDFVSRVEEHT